MDLNNLFGIKGKIAVISGGSRGIGEMIAAGFLANGVKVYITARKERELHLKAEELSDTYGGECISIASDLSTNDGINAFATQIKEKEEAERIAKEQKAAIDKEKSKAKTPRR